MRAPVLALLLLLSLLACALPARAQDAIHHCVDAQGNPVFTDQPCASQHATPVQAPAAAAPGLPIPLQRCASTAAGLRQHVIDAFAARDPNRLAGLMLWHGYGHVSAVDDIRALARLVRQPLLEIHFGDDPGSSADNGDDALQLRTLGGDDARFAVVRQAGCLWLRYGG